MKSFRLLIILLIAVIIKTIQIMGIDQYPPVPAPTAAPEDTIYNIVEQRPTLLGCKNVGGSNEEKEKCLQEKKRALIYSNLEYPVEVRENKN